MPLKQTCPRCGTALSNNALEGLCPTCVGRAAFADASAIDEAGDVGEPALSSEAEAGFARLKPEEVADQIGPYKLIEQIGQGGFGTVWVANQEMPVRRRVALKIVKLGMDTKEVVARFEQERQALAMMDHLHIAKVFDAGATRWGRPYFVMELVRGIKITNYCDQANLRTVDRLALFIQVCNAVQHAHQKGIIHRDLKPSNILVTLHDGEPVPKVIDFGVAKAIQQQPLTELTLHTQFAQMIGTPLYMSPEQAEMSGLDIDTRSDIYSLGVLLYELLAGRTPFDPEELMKQGLDEIRRTIREQEPRTPSMFVSTMAGERRMHAAQHRDTESAKWIGQLRGDLDWIVMKALEKDRARRYETANEFALDIKRHLASEPVLARPPSRLYRFRKLVRRNKRVFVAISAVVLTLVGGIAVSTWQAVRATEAERITGKERTNAVLERDRARAAERKAEEQRQRLEVAMAQAEQSAKTEAILRREAELQRSRAVADRQRAEELISFLQYNLQNKLFDAGKLVLIEDAVEKILAYYESVLAETLDDHILREKSVALNLKGNVLAEKGELEMALTVYYQTLAIREKVAGANTDDVQAQADIAVSCLKIGSVFSKRSQNSRPWFERGLSIVDRMAQHAPLTRFQQTLKDDLTKALKAARR